MAITQQNHIIAIRTPLAEDTLCLTSFSGREELGRLFQYEVEMVSDDASIDFTKIIGASVTIQLQNTSGAKRFFNGIVSRFSQHPSSTQNAAYRATIVPWLWLLTRTSDCRIWSGADTIRTAKEILQALFSARGFTDFDDSKLTGNYTPWEYCVQYRETDFNFVSRLMEQEGIYYFFSHKDGKHTLVLADSSHAHVAFPGYDEIHYRPYAPGTSDLEYIRDLAMSKEMQPGTFVHTDYDFLNPKKDIRTDPVIIDRQHHNSKFEIFDYPGEYADPGDGKQWAEVRIQELQARYQSMQGSADSQGLAAGYTFELQDIPRQDQNQKYLTVAVNHSAQSTAFESQGGAGGGQDTYHCSFTVLPASDAFRPARLTPKPLVQGPQTAVVVGPKGEEIYTDSNGRIKVHFHWDRYNDPASETSSCWIRVAQIWAGKKWGAVYIPRIGQEVVVEFLEGDPDLPLITGSVYNADQKAPYDPQAEKTKSAIKSNSTKGGVGFNEVRFEDLKGKEQIFMHAERNMDVRVKNDSMERVYGNRHLITGWEKDGAKGGDQREMVYQDKHLKVHRNQIEQIGDSMQLLIGGVDSGQGNQDIVLKGVKTESIEKDSNLHVKGQRNEQVDGDQSLTVGGSQQEKISSNHLVEAGQQIHLKAGTTLIIEAGTQLSLKVGGNFVDIGPSGVTISGTMVMINSGGAAGSAGDSSPTAPADAQEAAPTAPAIADDAKTGQKSAPG